MSILLYFLKVIVCSGILFSYYHLFLRNKRFHHYNRFYLLGTLVLSLVLPLFRIPVFNEDSSMLNQVMYQTARVITVSPDTIQDTLSPAQETSSLFTPDKLVWVVYGTGILVLLVVLGKSLGYIRKISRRYPFEMVDKLKFYQTQEPGTPFSFFRSIFWNTELNFDSQQGQQVFRHELFHVQQKHSADILLAELITMAGWFNPFFYFIKKELKAIHEFLADQYAASGNNRYQYAELLVQQVLATRPASLVNPFFQNQLKRRITMITQLNQSKYGYWSRVMVLPVSVILFLSVTLYAQENKQFPAPKQATPVIGNVAQGNIENSPAVTDTIPKPELEAQKLHELKVVAEKLEAEKKAVQFKYDEKRIVSSELAKLRDQQLVLQKLIQENKQNNDNNNALALQKALNKVVQQEKVLQEQKETNVNNNQQFNYEEKILQEKAQELHQLQEKLNTAKEQSDFVYKDDSSLMHLQRFFNRYFRYPQELIDNNGEGAVWYSFQVDESGKLYKYEVYDKEPAVQGKIYETVIVGYQTKPGNTTSTENPQQRLKNEVLRVLTKGASAPIPHVKTSSTPYYFKSTWKLERKK